jgi:parallel beta-helix repeat protein
MNRRVNENGGEGIMSDKRKGRGAILTHPGRTFTGLLVGLWVVAAGMQNASAHQDPPGCFLPGIDLDLRAVGTVSPASTIQYEATLAKPVRDIMLPEFFDFCAFSGGTLTIQRPNGTTMSFAVSCIGGSTVMEGCDPARVSQTFTVSYVVSASDFTCDAAGRCALIAKATYQNGVSHQAAVNVPGVSAMVTLPTRAAEECDCGEDLEAKCEITVTQPDGRVLSGYDNLQEAVDDAKDGLVPPLVGKTQPVPPNAPTIINVKGACKGFTVVDDRENLLIQGVAVAPTMCPPKTAALVSTLLPDPRAEPPSGSNGEVLKVVDSENILVQFLNIVDGGEEEGLEFKETDDSAAYCNCVTRNEVGYELDSGGGHELLDSALFRNEIGILLHKGTVFNLVQGNLVKENGDGIVLLDSPTEHNTVRRNTVKKNTGHCIDLSEADVNDILSNVIGGGASNPENDCGRGDITLEDDADDNRIEDNRDPDGNLVRVDCSGDESDGNFGNNCR